MSKVKSINELVNRINEKRDDPIILRSSRTMQDALKNLAAVLDGQTDVNDDTIVELLDIIAVVAPEKIGGGGSANLQSKEVEITDNGEQTITADEGYDGLSDVSLSVNVSGGGSLPVLPNGLRFSNSTASDFSWLESVDMNELTRGSSLFNGCTAITSVPDVFAPLSSAGQMFFGCSSLETCPPLITENVENMNYMFGGCSSLTTIPELDTSSVTNMLGMFENCDSLSNTSLNNILLMCINATNYEPDGELGIEKNLSHMGITQEQAEICETLSNYQDFLDAGWITGY